MIMNLLRKVISIALLVHFCFAGTIAKRVHHFVFFGHERGKIQKDKLFIETKALEGAQITYSWRQLEPEMDKYDFSPIREDLKFLKSKGKKLWIQFSDVTFGPQWINVPRYLLKDPKYNGGADKQYRSHDNLDEHPEHEGWMARRWDPAVQERLHKLFSALGKEFDGRIVGINLAESSVGVGETGKLFPKGFTPEIYRDAIVTNLKALKRAFPKSIALQYANFMPREWRPSDDKGYLRAVYRAARDSKVGVGGPDLKPYQPGHMGNSYPLIREVAGSVPVGVAVQDGNYAHVNPRTGKRVTIAGQIEFATEYLKVDYIFWCTEEPYYSNELIPFMRKRS